MDRPDEIEGCKVVEFWEYLGRQYAVIEWSLEDYFCYECLYYKYVGGWRRADGIHSSDAVYKLMRSRAEAAIRANETSRNLLGLTNDLLNDANAENEQLKKRVETINYVCASALAGIVVIKDGVGFVPAEFVKERDALKARVRELEGIVLDWNQAIKSDNAESLTRAEMKLRSLYPSVKEAAPGEGKP